jgi:hypothetical protein
MKMKEGREGRGGGKHFSTNFAPLAFIYEAPVLALIGKVQLILLSIVTSEARFGHTLPCKIAYFQYTVIKPAWVLDIR